MKKMGVIHYKPLQAIWMFQLHIKIIHFQNLEMESYMIQPYENLIGKNEKY
jgi:hypothetical protein